MIRKLAFVILAAVSVGAAAAPKKTDSDWAIATAPYRVVLHAQSAPDTPQAGWEIRLPDFGAGRPDMGDVVLLDFDGKEIALDGVWRGTGRTLLILAESMPAEGAAATLYFGGKSSSRMRSWSAKRSLLLETRRLPAGANITTFAGWQEAWKRSRQVDGAAFVPLIFHGDNPFGDSDHFMSRYTGMIKTPERGQLKFYSLSDDVSYVSINGRSLLEWKKNQPPPLNPKEVPVAKVSVEKGFTPVGYCHATVDAPGAMVLGWEQGGKLCNVPPESWVHPGKVNSGPIESADGAPVPLAELECERYLGYGNQWYISVRGFVAKPPDGWQVEWLWPDGHLDTGTEIRRVWMSLEPLHVVVRFRNGGRMIEGRHLRSIPRDMEAASVNHEKQMASFMELLGMEDPEKSAEPVKKAGFILAKDFLPSHEAAMWAEAWVKSAKPEADAWVDAVKMVIRETAKQNPQAALDRLTRLPDQARAVMGREFDLLEIDLRVFGLNDPLVIGLASKLGKSSDKMLANLAKIRLGDYHLLNGRTEEAASFFAGTGGDRKEIERRAPVIDRSHSLAIEDLINDKHLEEAREKLMQWELQHSAAKIEGDQLYWRARVMFMAGEWKLALQDLETSHKIRPGSPEEIDVLFWQGRALYELGRKDDARKIWNALVKDYPKHERAEAAKLWTAKL